MNRARKAKTAVQYIAKARTESKNVQEQFENLHLFLKAFMLCPGLVKATGL